MPKLHTFHIHEMNLDRLDTVQKIVFDSMEDLEEAHREINDGKDIYVVLGDEVIKLLNQELSSKVYDGRIKLAARYRPSAQGS
jgi:hypothetical protein